jgi:aryl-alcohol dehydrogenase-like predicted oxidoreductase
LKPSLEAGGNFIDMAKYLYQRQWQKEILGELIAKIAISFLRLQPSILFLIRWVKALW